MFQHTAARGRLVCSYYSLPWFMAFQHTAARGRLVPNPHLSQKNTSCFNTQPPEGGWLFLYSPETSYSPCFNTQPPEGGWQPKTPLKFALARFQHTAARGRLELWKDKAGKRLIVSTHSRPRAAGTCSCYGFPRNVCFNTQPPEGGWIYRMMCKLSC